MSASAVTWEMVEPQIMACTMVHPPANPLGVPLIDGMNAALDAADGMGDVKVVVVRSGLENFFAAGADIKHMTSIDGASFAAYGAQMRAMLDRLASPERVAIAAVEGLALGGGMELAMACTLRVATAAARFGLPEVKLGLIPGAGGTQRLPRLVGRGRALDIMLTARQVTGEEAVNMGLVDRLVPLGSAFSSALEIARELRAMSMPALRAVMRSVDAAFSMPVADGFAFEAAQEQKLFEDGEASEGLAAFVQKRPPVFA